MDKCYVTNKGTYDKLQQDVTGFLHDSLTPYFKNLGFREFTDNKEAGAFGNRIASIIKKDNLSNVIILFGGRGAGKSTFIKRLLFHTNPIEIAMHSEVSLVSLLYSSQTKEELTSEIWDKLIIKIDKDDVQSSDQSNILNIYHEEFTVFKKQFLVGLKENGKEYNKLVRRFLEDKLNDKKGFAEKLSLGAKGRNKALVIFIDNMDQLSPELQDVCFLTASEIAERLSCLTIVSMREERYHDASSRGVLDAYQTPGFHLSSPVIPEVIIKRIDYIIYNLNHTTDVDEEFGIKSITDLNTLKSFLKICKAQLKRAKSPLSYFLRYATHGDVRQALEFFKGFLTSGYTNINEMAPHPDWVFQVHQVIKPMMIPERFFYDERKSKISNIYQLRNDTNSSHFTGIRILNILHNRKADKTTHGFIDVKFLIHTLDVKYDSKIDCIKNLEIFLEKGLIESNNRVEVFSDDVNQIKLTALGNYIYEYLAFNFAYVDLVCLDCGLFDESVNNSFVRSAGKELRHYYDRDFMSRIELRIKRVREYISYLKAVEMQEFIDLGLEPTETKYTQKLEEEIESAIVKIKRSAKNKKVIENEYN